MGQRTICPICEKRRADRYCLAKGEKICAVDCGTGREVTIDCPSDCSYLLAAHRWEHEHPIPLPENEIPFPDVSFPEDLIRTHSAALSGIGYTVVHFAREQRTLTDAEALSAVHALAETYRTLGSGIYYEKPPDNVAAAALYAALAKFVEDEKQRAAEHPGYPPLRDSDVFYLLIFFERFGRLRSNGRPRTRSYVEFLRSQFPAEAAAPKDEPRIVMP